jgi:hypothetical protein
MVYPKLLAALAPSQANAPSRVPMPGSGFALSPRYNAADGTVTVQAAVNPLSAAAALIIAAPKARAVTVPSAETLATAGLLLDQLTVVLGAFDGEKLTTSVSALPAIIVTADLFKEMPVAGTTLVGALMPPIPQAFFGLTHTV